MLDSVVSNQSPSVDEVTAWLKRLRQGPALGRPMRAVRGLPPGLRSLLIDDGSDGHGAASEAHTIVRRIQQAIAQLNDDDRTRVEVDLNLTSDHRYATLTQRQESLAQLQKCAAKTISRNANRALDSLAYVLLTLETGNGPTTAARPSATQPHPDDVAPRESGPEDLRSFWGLSPRSRVDIVCSEIPAEECPEYASPGDRNYLRYAKFADLDTLIYVRTRFAQLAPTATVRDFAPSEYYDTQADILVVVGGPPWNAKYREFLPQLPFHFEPHSAGEDDPLVVPQLKRPILGPRWTARGELLEDIAVLTRLTLAQGTRVFLLGGCLTLGVLGAARCLLDDERGSRSAHRIVREVGDADFVLAVEARRVGGITDIADLSATDPLILLSRKHTDPFTTVIDNSERYTYVSARAGHQHLVQPG